MAAGQPLRGLVGQSMNGARSRVVGFAGMPVIATAPASGSVTVRKPCTALIALWGGGASGNVGVQGGGGAGAAYARVFLRQGDVISYVLGAGGAGDGFDGVDSTLTLPNGRVLTAGGGKAAGAGGSASGGDLNRRGGAGGNTVPGQAGEGGGAGGAAGASRGGGGGAAGFSEIISDLIGAAGTNDGGSGPGSAPGGGTGADAGATGAGGAGRVIIVMVTTPL